MDNITDQQLIVLYLDGNIKAFDGLINRHAQVLYRFVFKLLNNKEEAHDIVQETFIKSWKNIRKFDLKKSFKTWIFTIAHHSAIDHLRKRKNVNFTSLDDDSDFEQSIPDDRPLQEELFERKENIDLVQRALETLSIESKTIVLLHDGEYMTFEEIAKIINKPMNTIKSKYRRALISLKNHIVSENAPK